jgi:hypothetical protein
MAICEAVGVNSETIKTLSLWEVWVLSLVLGLFCVVVVSYLSRLETRRQLAIHKGAVDDLQLINDEARWHWGVLYLKSNLQR